MHYVYVLISLKSQKRYIGMTSDLETRIKSHNKGSVRFTKGYRPWSLLHLETFPTKYVAHQRELFLKSGQGRKWLDNKF